MTDAVEIVSDLVKIPSVSPFGRNETERRERFERCREVLAYLEEFLQKQGAQTEPLVFENGQIVGMGGIVRKSDREAEVCKLHVRKEFKGRGYGEKLLNYLERMARLKGFEKLRLHVTMSQRPAINLYRKSAFLPTGNEVYMTEIEGKTYEYDTLYMEKLIV